MQKDKLSKEEIIASNTIIADFMNWKHHEDSNYDKHEMSNLKYHTSWDWIMPVVEKIENIGHSSIIEQLYHGEHRVYFIDKTDNTEKTPGARSYDKIEAVWLAVIAFINWYNTILKHLKQ